jgi:hypothetical protein
VHVQAARHVSNDAQCGTAPFADREQSIMQMSPPPSPTPPSEPEDEPTYYPAQRNDGADVGDVEDDVGEEQGPSGSDQPYSDPASNVPLPRATLPNLILTQQIIDDIKTGHLNDDIQNIDKLNLLNNPPKTSQPMDATTILSIAIFKELILGSQQMYDGVHNALYRHTPRIEIHSHYITRQKLEIQTGVSEIRTDSVQRDA